MKLNLVGITTIVLPDRQFGDTDNVSVHSVVARISTNQPERFIASNWHGVNNYEFTVPIWKCTAVFALMNEVEDWLIANFGKLVTLQFIDLVDDVETIICQMSGYISLKNVIEQKNEFIASFSLAQEFV